MKYRRFVSDFSDMHLITSPLFIVRLAFLSQKKYFLFHIAT